MSNPMIKIEMENGEADITANGSGTDKDIEGMIGTAPEAFEKAQEGEQKPEGALWEQ